MRQNLQKAQSFLQKIQLTSLTFTALLVSTHDNLQFHNEISYLFNCFSTTQQKLKKKCLLSLETKETFSSFFYYPRFFISFFSNFSKISPFNQNQIHSEYNDKRANIEYTHKYLYIPKISQIKSSNNFH